MGISASPRSRRIDLHSHRRGLISKLEQSPRIVEINTESRFLWQPPSFPFRMVICQRSPTCFGGVDGTCDSTPCGMQVFSRSEAPSPSQTTVALQCGGFSIAVSQPCSMDETPALTVVGPVPMSDSPNEVCVVCIAPSTFMPCMTSVE